MTVDENDCGSRLISEQQMSRDAEGIKGDGSRPLVRCGAPRETTGSGDVYRATGRQ